MRANNRRGLGFHLCLIINVLKTSKHITPIIPALSERLASQVHPRSHNWIYHERFRPIFTANPEDLKRWKKIQFLLLRSNPVAPLMARWLRFSSKHKGYNFALISSLPAIESAAMTSPANHPRRPDVFWKMTGSILFMSRPLKDIFVGVLSLTAQSLQGLVTWRGRVRRGKTGEGNSLNCNNRL